MRQKKSEVSLIIPVLMSFFVMSFIDLVGTGVDELKKDASVPAYILQLIPFVAFIWFFILSVPVGIWQDKVGKKKALNVAIIITAVGLMFPILGNSFPIILIAFSLLGIGNTILQVSANPLLVDVVPPGRSSSFLSLSQSIKSVGSILGPFIAAIVGPFLANLFGDESEGSWRWGLYLFAIISVLTSLWLSTVKIDETKSEGERASMASCFKLLGNSFIFLLVIGIFVVVGIDVAINSNIATFLTDKLGVDAETAKYGKSVYFFAKMAGTLVGAGLLTVWSPRKFLTGSSILAGIGLILIMVTNHELSAWILIGVISLGVSNIFPLIFSIAVEKMPTRSNEISGLMMMAISGGAVIPFITGYAMSININGGMMVLLLCALYLLWISVYVRRK